MRVNTGLFLILFLSCAAYGQSFEVASIRPSAPPDGGRGIRMGRSGGPGSNDPTRVTYENIPLYALVTEAYDVRVYQVSGPTWLNTERFDIDRKSTRLNSSHIQKSRMPSSA